jgi:uncharacterized protein (TIGR02246 family)
MKPIALGVCVLALLAPAAAFGFDSDSASLVSRFMQAWNAADARALSMNFAPDADFVSPFGDLVKGRANIEAFYARAFAHGYAGSRATGEVVSEKMLAPEMALLDAQWTIAAAHKPDGAPIPGEKGILVAVIRKDASGWHILALRENEGARGLVTFSPPVE